MDTHIPFTDAVIKLIKTQMTSQRKQDKIKKGKIVINLDVSYCLQQLAGSLEICPKLDRVK